WSRDTRPRALEDRRAIAARILPLGMQRQCSAAATDGIGPVEYRVGVRTESAVVAVRIRRGFEGRAALQGGRGGRRGYRAGGGLPVYRDDPYGEGVLARRQKGGDEPVAIVAVDVGRLV